MHVQEGLPGLSSWSCGVYSSHVLLNSPLAHADAQLEQFAPDAFCSPQSILPCHLFDQGHGLLRDPWLERGCSGLVSPKELKAQVMPAQQRLWLNNEERLLPGANDSGQ